MSTSEHARLFFLPVIGAPSSTRGMKMTTTTNLSYPLTLPSFHIPWSAPAALLVSPKHQSSAGLPINTESVPSSVRICSTCSFDESLLKTTLQTSPNDIGRFLMFIP
ncbi:hypothetical protein CPC08DRAFT_391849 [Agrocybe pediades]|nr:hypothetical protein CPC08DRAFT_391849 [Agrocybe pediades]